MHKRKRETIFLVLRTAFCECFFQKSIWEWTQERKPTLAFSHCFNLKKERNIQVHIKVQTFGNMGILFSWCRFCDSVFWWSVWNDIQKNSKFGKTYREIAHTMEIKHRRKNVFDLHLYMSHMLKINKISLGMKLFLWGVKLCIFIGCVTLFL